MFTLAFCLPEAQILGRSGTYLGSASGVLGCAASNELCVVVLDEVLVEAHVLFFGEDGVVGLEPVFLEHTFISGCATLVVSPCSKYWTI